MSNVSDWVKRENTRTIRALETASRHFDRGDAIDVHTIEAIYGQESSFGQNRRKMGTAGAAGDFQMESETARSVGLKVTKNADERFDLEASSAAAAKYLKNFYDTFKNGRVVDAKGTRAKAIQDSEERKLFDIAAYNAGAKRIAAAQDLAFASGKNPQKWDDVKVFLEAAGATKAKAKEIRDYVYHVTEYEKEFQKKSKADAKSKFRKGASENPYPPGEHWVTIRGRHILIKDRRPT